MGSSLQTLQTQHAGFRSHLFAGCCCLCRTLCGAKGRSIWILRPPSLPRASLKHAFVEETKEVCYIEPEKVCETKTRTYKVITGYEDGECKEIEVCKFPGFHHGKRSAEPHGYVECEKETKEVCKKEPVVEEKTKE